MSRLARLIALLILPLALGTAACGANSEPGGGGGAAPTGSAGDDREADGDAAAGEGLTVVASVYPLAWVAEQVAPGAEVILLADAGDEPHDLDLTPRAREALETADVVLHMGDIGYQPQVESAVADRGGAVVSVADVVGSDAFLERDEGHDDDHGHGEEGGHDDGEIDPHAWFHAGLMAEVAEATGAALAGADAAGGDAYQSAADALASDLRDLHAEVGSLLGGDCAHDLVIVSHEAYAYLLEPHGLRQEGISSSAGHGPASPQRIAELVRLARSEGIEHVLAEPVEGREDAHAVASEANLEVLDIHSLEVRGDELDGRGFDELLWEQARTAARAMGCE